MSIEGKPAVQEKPYSRLLLLSLHRLFIQRRLFIPHLIPHLLFISQLLFRQMTAEMLDRDQPWQGQAPTRTIDPNG